jgi:hypothetical protein
MGRQQYDITVTTSSEMYADTKDPIYITLLGTEGKTAMKVKKFVLKKIKTNKNKFLDP